MCTSARASARRIIVAMGELLVIFIYDLAVYINTAVRCKASLM
jgi:hypothetical protein